jgi:hypothetical protein
VEETGSKLAETMVEHLGSFCHLPQAGDRNDLVPSLLDPASSWTVAESHRLGSGQAQFLPLLAPPPPSQLPGEPSLHAPGPLSLLG